MCVHVCVGPSPAQHRAGYPEVAGHRFMGSILLPLLLLSHAR